MRNTCFPKTKPLIGSLADDQLKEIHLLTSSCQFRRSFATFINIFEAFSKIEDHTNQSNKSEKLGLGVPKIVQRFHLVMVESLMAFFKKMNTSLNHEFVCN